MAVLNTPSTDEAGGTSHRLIREPDLPVCDGVPGRRDLPREPLNALDELVLDVVSILERHDIRYVVVSGYVTVLLGRSRATEDIDVIVAPFDETTASDLVTDLRDAGYWGAAMPLDDLHATLEDALYLYHLLEGTLTTDRLEAYVEELGVEEEYDGLTDS